MEATKLSIFPFMKEIVDALFEAVSKDRKYLLTIFSGHDTVIAPVLAALGKDIFQDTLQVLLFFFTYALIV